MIWLEVIKSEIYEGLWALPNTKKAVSQTDYKSLTEVFFKKIA